MRALLNTLGATVWGVVAIILAAAVATLGYRLKYRLRFQSAGSPDRLIELVNYLVRKEAVAVGPS
jgi:hypothetical protein